MFCPGDEKNIFRDRYGLFAEGGEYLILLRLVRTEGS